MPLTLQNSKLPIPGYSSSDEVLHGTDLLYFPLYYFVAMNGQEIDTKAYYMDISHSLSFQKQSLI